MSRPVPAVVLVMLTTALAGCAPDGAEAPLPTGGIASRPGTTPTAGPGTPTAFPTDAVVEDALAIVGSGDAAEIEEAVASYGGEVVRHIEETDTYVARFDVASVPELIEVRDALREEGINANLIVVVSPAWE